MQTITRKQAKALGQSVYYTGKPCKRGHDSARSVSNHGCLACMRDDQRKRRNSDGLVNVTVRVKPEHVRALQLFALGYQ